MRLFFLTLLFFCGPMVLIFTVRNGFFLWKAWRKHQREHPEPKIVDVTPIDKSSRLFVVVSICVSLAIFSYAWVHTSDDQDENRLKTDQHQVYVPSHMDADGRLVKGHFVDSQEDKNSK